MSSPVFREENIVPCPALLEKLREAAEALRPDETNDLHRDLMSAIADLETACRATVPISRGHVRIGFGQSKANKAIACDQVTSIVKQIKALRAW